MKRQVVKLEKNTVDKIFEKDEKKNLLDKDCVKENEIHKFLDEIVERDFNAITLFREMNNFKVLEKAIF